MCCKRCGNGIAWILLIVGLVLLYKDITNAFLWGIEGITLAFIIGGIAMWGCSSCGDCQACCGTSKSTTKKRKK